MAEPKSTSSTASPNNNTSKTQIDSMSLSEILLLRAILNDGPSTPPEELTAEKLKEKLADYYYSKAKKAIRRAFPERVGQIKINIKDVGLLDDLEKKLKGEGFSVKRKM